RASGSASTSAARCSRPRTSAPRRPAGRSVATSSPSASGTTCSRAATGTAMTDVLRTAAGAAVAAALLLTGSVSALAGAGSLDASFDFGGTLTTPIGGGDDVARALVLQSDGKLVAAGSSWNGSNFDFALARYDPDGSLDPSFNGTGTLTTQIGGGNDEAFGLALQPDGRIVVSGYSSNGSNFDFALVRYDPDGSLDPTFNGTGKVTTAIGGGSDLAYSVAVQPDGRIVAAGLSSNGSNYDFAVARYTASGSLDTSFNGSGKATTPIGASDDVARALVLQPDGRIVAAGYSSSAGNLDFALARYNANGSLDTSLNGSGKLTTAVGSGADIALAVALQSDGRIVAAGDSSNGTDDDFALARYNANGSLDTGFAGSGKLTTPIGSGNDGASAVLLQPDGRIVAAGDSSNGSSLDFALARYNPNGSLDSSFGGSGKVTASIGGGDDVAAAAVLQPDGKIVAAGFSSNGANNDFALARFHGAALTLSSPRAEAGASVTVSGAGWRPGEGVDVFFDTTDVALAIADQSGSIRIDVTIPGSAPPGAHWLTALGRTSGYGAQNTVLVVSDWPMFRFGAAHTGANPFENTLSPGNAASLRLLWRTRLGTGGSDLTPASAGGVAFGVGPDGRVYALDGVTGQLLWQSSAAVPNVGSAPVAAAGSVFVGSTNRRVYAFDGRTGRQRWASSAIGAVSAPIAVAGGNLYVGTSDTDRLYALSAASGVRPSGWAVFAATGPIEGAPTVADGSVVFATGAPGDEVIALDAATGALQWRSGPFA